MHPQQNNSAGNESASPLSLTQEPLTQDSSIQDPISQDSPMQDQISQDSTGQDSVDPNSTAPTSTTPSFLDPNYDGMGLHELPTELLIHIVNYVAVVDSSCLSTLRFVHSNLERIARNHVFHVLKLYAHPDLKAEIGFFNIAKSRRLNPCVRVVTIDTWSPPSPEGEEPTNPPDENWIPPLMFLSVMPYLRYFRQMTDFSIFLGHNNQLGIPRGVRNDVSCWVMNVALRCLAGTWEMTKQIRIDKTMRFRGVRPLYGLRMRTMMITPIPIKKFVVKLMDNPVDWRVLETPVFKMVANSEHIEEFEMSIAEDYYQNDIIIQDVHSGLRNTWLEHSLGENLSELSLYWRGPGNDTFPPLTIADDWKADMSGSLPALRSLILGRYAFTSWEQVEWIAGVGRGNGGQGLEKLRIDDCRVAYQGHSEAIQRKAIRLDSHGVPELYDQAQGPIRWHKMIAFWVTRLPNLNHFEFSAGSWSFLTPAVSECLFSWIVLLARIYEGNPASLSDSSFERFNLKKVPFADYFLYKIMSLPLENTSRTYCSSRQVATGSKRAFTTDRERHQDLFGNLVWPFPWYTEQFLRDFDNAALGFMYRYVEERNYSRAKPVLQNMLAGLGYPDGRSLLG